MRKKMEFQCRRLQKILGVWMQIFCTLGIFFIFYFLYNFFSLDLSFIFIFSYESGILENPNNSAPENLYKLTKDPLICSDKFHEIEITFAKGVPSSVKDYETNEIIRGPLKIMEFLNTVGGNHGIGRIDIVENRFIGLKVQLIFKKKNFLS